MNDQRPLLSFRIIDSALCLAAAGALAYVAGYTLETRAANLMGIPPGFFPQANVERIMVLGTNVLLLLFLGAAATYAGTTAIWERLPVRIRSRLCDHFTGRFRKHRFFYVAFLAVAGFSALELCAYHLPIAKLISHDSRFPDVKILHTKSETSLRDRDLRLVTRHDGLVLLWDITSLEFVVLREDDISLLVLARNGTGQRERIEGP